MALFTIENLTFTYPDAASAAVSGVNTAIEPGSFTVICGYSGCGKTTLLRHLKTVLTPHGTRSGAILLDGRALADVPEREQASRVAFVLQDPDKQIVTDTVAHELSFGLESLGVDARSIRLRIAEMASFFGIESWFSHDISKLSGGQKQLLNLASVMAMQPEALVLDEPTAMLDPIAASEFLSSVKKLNRELGVTVILSEHRLEEALPLADRALVMDAGRLVADGTPEDAGRMLHNARHPMFAAMPSPMRVALSLQPDAPRPPVTVRGGRAFLRSYGKTPALSTSESATQKPAGKEAAALAIRDAWFRYEKQGHDVIRGLSLTVNRGEWLAIVGGNGAGKTTALSLLSGLRAPQRGSVRVLGREVRKWPYEALFHGVLGVMPQEPQTLFLHDTVREELADMLSDTPLGAEQKQARIRDAAIQMRIENLLGSHPYDISAGEQQRVALAMVMMRDPEILLLDEPTKGMDAAFKQTFAAILSALQKSGKTIVMVSHDIEFCAQHAGRCALFFDGAIVSDTQARAFFAGNSFYTTAANRMARPWLPDAVTVADVVRAYENGAREEPS